MKTFYQTTPLTADQYIACEDKAKSQDESIYNLIKERGGEWTAWQIKQVFPSYEITSIRRALNSLEFKYKLIVRTGYVIECKGRPSGKYALRYTEE